MIHWDFNITKSDISPFGGSPAKTLKPLNVYPWPIRFHEDTANPLPAFPIFFNEHHKALGRFRESDHRFFASEDIGVLHAFRCRFYGSDVRTRLRLHGGKRKDTRSLHR